MGFKKGELTATPTPTTPPIKTVKVKAFQVSRSDTTAALKAYVPRGSSILDITLITATASDATTSATVSIGTTSSANELVNGHSVLSATGVLRPTTALVAGALAQEEGVPHSGAEVALYGKYAFTGANTTGGPWTVLVTYAE